MNKETRAHKAAPVTKSQVIDQRLRSAAAATASQQKRTGSRTPSKERWVTKPTGQSHEFGASLGRDTFERVTGTYIPSQASPAWDPTLDATGAPFYRSTPTGELDPDVQLLETGEEDAALGGEPYK